MAQDTSGAPRGTVAAVIPGEMAARIDRLPTSFMVWEIALLIQLGWATSASTDGIARTLYPYIWLPAHEISSFEYSVLYAMQAGISILIGGYTIGWLSDKIGRRKALVGSAALAGLFIWPFAYVTNFWALFFLSIADTLGFAGFLAINVVYMTEMTGPKTRGRLVMGAQALAIFVLYVVLLGLVPHYLIPNNYRPYLFLLAGLNILVAIGLYFRMPESPRWLEARGHHEQARLVMEKIEELVKSEVKRTFNPEFLNRIDEVILFQSLSDADLIQIVDLLVNQLNANLAQKSITISVDGEAKKWILDKTLGDRSYGARPLRRALQRYIEDPLSEALIGGQIMDRPAFLEVYIANNQLFYRSVSNLTEEKTDGILLYSA